MVAKIVGPQPTSLDFEISKASYVPESTMAGTLNRNENLAAASRLIPKNLAAVIVTPLREKPGIRANDCAKPKKNIFDLDI